MATRARSVRWGFVQLTRSGRPPSWPPRTSRLQGVEIGAARTERSIRGGTLAPVVVLCAPILLNCGGPNCPDSVTRFGQVVIFARGRPSARGPGEGFVCHAAG